MVEYGNETARFLNMVREFTVIVEEDEEGYLVGEVPELKCCFTQARSLDDLMKRMEEAVRLCLEANQEECGDLCLVCTKKGLP